jgi:hypothetical protein
MYLAQSAGLSQADSPYDPNPPTESQAAIILLVIVLFAAAFGFYRNWQWSEFEKARLLEQLQHKQGDD